MDRVLTSFSLKRNFKKLFASHKYSPEDPEFEIFNFFKVFSISLIVLGNTYLYTLGGPIKNLDIVSKLFKTHLFIFVFQADL